MKSKINEFDLQQFDRCPVSITGTGLAGLYSDTALFPISTAVSLADAMWKKLSLSRFLGEPVQDVSLLDPSNMPDFSILENKTIRKVGRRVRELAETYQVMQPFAKYCLSLPKIDVFGRSSVVREKKSSVMLSVSFFDEPADRQSDFIEQRVNLVSMIRWLQMRSQGVDSGAFAALQFSVVDDRAIITNYSVEQVRSHVFEVVSRLDKPMTGFCPGSYCQSCSLRSCLTTVKSKIYG